MSPQASVAAFWDIGVRRSYHAVPLGTRPRVGYTDGGPGRPCEVPSRGNEPIVSNMGWPNAASIKKEYDRPCTSSVIKLKQPPRTLPA